VFRAPALHPSFVMRALKHTGRALGAIALVLACSSAARPRHAPRTPRFFASPDARVASLPASAFRNANGSPRLRDDQYQFVRRRIVPLLVRWSRDPRLGIDPAYATALLLKESGGDTLAVSGAPALGLAQLTVAADSDMRLMATEYHFQWMAPELAAWPRDASVRAPGATAAAIDSLLARGTVTAHKEYLFEPVASARASIFWIRLLANKWTTDFWPGGYGPEARQRINGGRPLTQSQMLDLVTISYNRGYSEVHTLVRRYGAEWTHHLAELPTGAAEAADYLERIRAYTALLQEPDTAVRSLPRR
jgi:hypothetical protein